MFAQSIANPSSMNWSLQLVNVNVFEDALPPKLRDLEYMTWLVNMLLLEFGLSVLLWKLSHYDFHA